MVDWNNDESCEDLLANAAPPHRDYGQYLVNEDGDDRDSADDDGDGGDGSGGGGGDDGDDNGGNDDDVNDETDQRTVTRSTATRNRDTDTHG